MSHQGTDSSQCRICRIRTFAQTGTLLSEICIYMVTHASKDAIHTKEHRVIWMSHRLLTPPIGRVLHYDNNCVIHSSKPSPAHSARWEPLAQRQNLQNSFRQWELLDYERNSMPSSMRCRNERQMRAKRETSSTSTKVALAAVECSRNLLAKSWILPGSV